MRAALSALVALALAAPAAGQGLPAPRVDPSITDGSAQRALSAARETWRAAGIHSYRMRIAVSCFCAPPMTAPVTVTVRGDRPQHPPSTRTSVATVPRLLRVIRSAIDERAARLDVAYNRYGVPTHVYVDPDARLADDEIGYAIDRFQRLAKRR